MTKNRGQAVTWVLIVIAVLLVGGGAYYYGTSKTAMPQNLGNNTTNSTNTPSQVNITANGSHNSITVPSNKNLSISWVAPQDSQCLYSGTGPNASVGGGQNSAPFPSVYTMNLGPGTESVLVPGVNVFTIRCSKIGQNIGSDSISVTIDGSKATIDSLKNATYDSPEGLGKFYTLQNGQYQNGQTSISIDSTDSNHLIYADLEMNGEWDAVVLVKENDGGSGTFHSVQIMKGTNAKWLARASLGDRTAIYSMYTTTYATSTILSINLTPWPNPAGNVQTWRYQLISGKLVKIN